jgi:simple sugar transport system ATP-binding protein
LHDICKTYSGNRRPSLSQANWSIRRGEIHAILGENGAGKSSLMHILSGFIRPDSGEIRINGTKIRLNSAQAARKHGIGMVRQRPELCPGLKVWEGCVLAKGAHDGVLFSPRAERERAASRAARFNLNIPLDVLASELSDGERHTAAILSLLLCDTDCLIFDEPSAVLNKSESSALEQLYKNLKHKGRALAIITHKLEEALAIADTITVMRNGYTIDTRPAQDWTQRELITGMFGLSPAYDVTPPEAWRARQAVYTAQAAAETADGAPPRRPPLSVRNLDVSHNGTRVIRRLNLEIAAGEIVGVVGRKKDGLEALELAVCGFARPSSGEILVSGGQVDGNPAAFRAAGGAFMASAPRRLVKESGIAGCDRNLSLYDNLIIHTMSSWISPKQIFRFNQRFSRRELNFFVEAIKERARIRVKSKRRLRILSGGMLQRLILEREIECSKPGSLLVISQALWGLDFEQRRRLSGKIQSAAESGRGVLLFAASTEEAAALCTRILTLKNGVVTGAGESSAALSPPSAYPGGGE